MRRLEFFVVLFCFFCSFFIVGTVLIFEIVLFIWILVLLLFGFAFDFVLNFFLENLENGLGIWFVTSHLKDLIFGEFCFIFV